MTDRLIPQPSPVSAARLRRPGRGRRGFATVVPPLATVVVLLAIWELAVDGMAIPRYLLPAPSVIVTYAIANSAVLWRNLLATGWEIVVGFGLSVAIGFPLGIVVVGSPLFARTVYPLLVASQTFPKLAVAPLFIVWFGFGLMPKLLIAFLIAFFPVVIDTAVGLQSVKEDTLVLARSMGLSPTQTFVKIRLPQALPSIFGGLKIGITLAVVGAIVGEFLGTDAGLGYLIVTATGTVNTPMLFSALVVLTVLGLAFYGLVTLAEHLAIPWASEDRQDLTPQSM